MGHHHQAVRATALAALAALFLVAAVASAGATSASPRTTAVGARAAAGPLDNVKHIVVIYEENHSFDNLYGGWEGVNGLSNADAAHTTQVDQQGTPYSCLRQNDVNLTAIAPTCTDAAHNFASAFANKWFTIDTIIPPTRRRARRRSRRSRSRTGC